MSAVLETAFAAAHPASKAQADAADAQQAEWVRARQIDLPAAGAAYAALGDALKRRRSPFAEVAAQDEMAVLRSKLAMANTTIARLSKPALDSALSYAWQTVSELGPGPVLCGYIFDAGDEDTKPSLDLRQVFVGARNVIRALADELHERMAKKLLADCRARFVSGAQPW